MTPIQDTAGWNFGFTRLGVTVGLPCYFIFEKSSNLVVRQRGNQPVEQAAVEATRRRNGIQRIRRKQPTEHDERLGRTVGLMPCSLIVRKSSNLVVGQRGNQPVEQATVQAPRRPNEIQRIGRKQPTEHDERLAWVRSETVHWIQNFAVTCGLATLSTVVHLCAE